MPFSATASIISTDLDNMVRGLNRDNSDTSLTGTVAETNLKSFNVSANTMGATGGFHVMCNGAISGTAGTKTFRLKLGGFTVATISHGAGTTSNWFFDAWCFNTSTAAQRWHIFFSVNDATTVQWNSFSTSVDTTANQTLSVTGQLGNTGDTVTAKMWDVFIVQIN